VRVGLLADDTMRFARVRLGVVPGHVGAIRHRCRIERGTSSDRLKRRLLEGTTVSGCNYAGEREEERQQSGDPLPTTSHEADFHGNSMIPACEESRMIQVNPLSGSRGYVSNRPAPTRLSCSAQSERVAYD